MQALKNIWLLMEGSKIIYLGAVAATAIATVFSLLPPLVIRFTVDTVLGNDNPTTMVELWLAHNLWFCGLAIVLLTSMRGLFTYFRGRWAAKASEQIAQGLRERLYDHLQKMPYNYHVKAKTGDLIQRCTSDVDTIRHFLVNQIIEMGRTIFIVLFSLGVMLSLSLHLTVAAVVILPVMPVISYVFFKKIRATFQLVDEKEAELSTVLQEHVSCVRVVRAFGRQLYEIDKFEEKNSQFRDLSSHHMHLLSIFWALTDMLCWTQIALTLFAGIYLTVTGAITLGTLLVFNFYVGMLIWPMRNLGRIISDAGRTEVSIGRVNQILNSPPEGDTEGAIRPSLRGDIVFDNVVFGYDDQKPVLNGLSFSIKKGETVAFLGPTGSGKSTIMHILLRLYDYNQGQISINGVELRNIEKSWLREKVGIVLQEPFLFSKTIRSNMQMARDDVEDLDIYEAAQTASIHDVINRFRHGYETVLGERGVTLSGGQKQRAAIARTLIKHCDLLIFDDSLSAVDTETDAQIRSALKERQKDVTTCIISQRISTLMEADRIFIIQNGQVADVGTHEELIYREGLYKRIWQIQNMLEDDLDESL